MFRWIRTLFAPPQSLSDLGFQPRFYDLEDAPRGSVIVSVENDDDTPMEFVVQVLEEYFGLPRKTAVELMLKVHTQGSADVRAMGRRDADRLVRRVREEATKRPYPLQCRIRPANERRDS